MKKIFAFALVAVLLLSLCACAPADGGNTAPSDDTTAGNNTTGQLMVGYSKVQIDPTESVPLQGYGSTEKRMSTGFKSHIYHIALAITDPAGNTAIMIAADACTIATDIADEIRQGIKDECGVPVENVIISACHQHSVADMGNSKVSSAITFKDTIFVPGAIEAAKEALENRAPAKVQSTTVQTENLNFVRHYLMEDGTYAGNNFGDLTKPIKEHATDVDGVMQLIKFVREGQTTMDGKKAKDIILTNYQGHPNMVGSKDTNVHSDMVGVYRDELEAKLDCHAIYFSGASGNVLFSSKITEENITTDYKDHGQKLAKYAINAEGTYTDVSLTEIKSSTVTYTGSCDHSEDHRLAEANAAWNEFNSGNNYTSVIADANKFFLARGFNSRYHASAIITKSSLPETQDIELTTIALGDVAFVAAPYEMFCDNGMYIKESSPFAMTVITTIANGSNSYMPTKEAFDYNCYEANQCRYIRGTAEELADEFVGMLKDLHSQY